MTHQEIIAKFLKQTEGILLKETAYKLIESVEELEKLGTIAEIARAFS